MGSIYMELPSDINSAQRRHLRYERGPDVPRVRGTPCASWDLETLLDHLGDSIGVLHEAIATAGISPESAQGYDGPGGTRSRGCAARQPDCWAPSPLPGRPGAGSPSRTVS